MKVELNIKTAAIGGITLIAVAILYYFVIVLPQESKAARIFAAQQECREVGEKSYKEYLEDEKKKNGILHRIGEGLPSGFVIIPPTYGYSKKLNTCLYASGFHGSWTKDDVHDFFNFDFVKDSFSGSMVIYAAAYN